MNPATQTKAVEQEYESFDGVRRTRTYWHWADHRWVTVTSIDPGRRRRTRRVYHQGYSPISRRQEEETSHGPERR